MEKQLQFTLKHDHKYAETKTFQALLGNQKTNQTGRSSEYDFENQEDFQIV